MAQPSPWPTIHEERAALLADLFSLTDASWDTPSRCQGWTVQQVLAHMVAAADTSPGPWLAKFARSGFRFQTLVSRDIARLTEGGPQATLARFAAVTSSSGHPPGPVDSWLGETIVHAEDIRRPLGIVHDYPLDAVTRVASFYHGSNLLIGSKRRVAALTLRASDIDWSIGSGPEVRGPAIAILSAMSGRADALGQLAGDGAGTLRTTMGQA
jgi:uncharacterized protein (TIGR03083 family)